MWFSRAVGCTQILCRNTHRPPRRVRQERRSYLRPTGTIYSGPGSRECLLVTSSQLQAQLCVVFLERIVLRRGLFLYHPLSDKEIQSFKPRCSFISGAGTAVMLGQILAAAGAGDSRSRLDPTVSQMVVLLVKRAIRALGPGLHANRKCAVNFSGGARKSRRAHPTHSANHEFRRNSRSQATSLLIPGACSARIAPE